MRFSVQRTRPNSVPQSFACASDEGLRRCAVHVAAAARPDWEFSRIAVTAGRHAANDRAKRPAVPAAPDEDVSAPTVTDHPAAGSGSGAAGSGSGAAGSGSAAPPAAKPSRTAKLKSGPTYTPSGTIKATKSGGKKSATFTLGAEFENDPARGLDPSFGEIRQFIKWTNAADVPNHAGFQPKSAYSVNTWYEDRDSAGKRYGHRSGPYSECVTLNHYADTKGTQNCAAGEVFVGEDDPIDGSGAKTGKWNFELRAIDTGNGDRSLGTPAAVTVDWNV